MAHDAAFDDGPASPKLHPAPQHDRDGHREMRDRCGVMAGHAHGYQRAVSSEVHAGSAASWRLRLIDGGPR